MPLQFMTPRPIKTGAKMGTGSAGLSLGGPEGRRCLSPFSIPFRRKTGTGTSPLRFVPRLGAHRAWGLRLSQSPFSSVYPQNLNTPEARRPACLGNYAFRKKSFMTLSECLTPLLS